MPASAPPPPDHAHRAVTTPDNKGCTAGWQAALSEFKPAFPGKFDNPTKVGDEDDAAALVDAMEAAHKGVVEGVRERHTSP